MGAILGLCVGSNRLWRDGDRVGEVMEENPSVVIIGEFVGWRVGGSVIGVTVGGVGH